jgi:hypothetical protein
MEIHWELIIWNNRKDNLKLFKGVVINIETLKDAEDEYNQTFQLFDHVQLIEVHTTKKILKQKGH